MELVTIRLKPLEPLMLRGPGEFDPSSRGVYSYASSLALPRPSTMIGMLISMLSSKERIPECLSVGGWEDLLEKCYIKILDRLGIEAIRGPYITKDNNLYTPVILGKSFLIIDHNQVIYFFLEKEKYGDILEKLSGEDSTRNEETAANLRLIEEELMEDWMRKYIIEHKHASRTGIHLRSRELGKIAREGYIFTASYISYPADVEINFFLAMRDPSKIVNLPTRVAAKLGGEERIVKIDVEHSDRSNIVTGVLSNIEKARYAILVSPMPFKDGDLSAPLIAGEYTTIGYGFSIAKGRRKPVSPSIREGSILKIDSNGRKPSLEEMLLYGLYSILGLTEKDYKYGRLGYASFLPLAR